MALIPHAEAEKLARKAVVLDLGDIQRQGEIIKGLAEHRARTTLEKAQRERERLLAGAAEEGRRQGFEEGFRKGVEEGREQGRAEAERAHGETLAAVAAAWNGALEVFHAERDELLEDAARHTLELAAEVARRVTRRVAELDPSVIAEQLSVAVLAALAPTRLLIALHPDDEAVARRALPSILSRLAESPHAELHIDPEAPRGSCLVRSGSGTIDASIGTQLDRIISALLPDTGIVGAHGAERDAA